MSDRNVLLELSTAVVEPDVFTVDGEEYQLLGLNHLSDQDEVTVMAMYARYAKMADVLTEAPNQKKAEEVAKVMRKQRLGLLAKMTTCPVDILGKLPIKSQIALMNAIGEEMEEKDDEGTGGDEA